MSHCLIKHDFSKPIDRNRSYLPALAICLRDFHAGWHGLEMRTDVYTMMNEGVEETNNSSTPNREIEKDSVHLGYGPTLLTIPVSNAAAER
jgi:hypothetical protein